MALFKISKGLKANLPSAKTAGHCWYTIDDSLFYIDYEDESGKLQRKALNAKDAETLTGASLSTILNASDIQIPTSNAVLSALAGKSDTSHTHDDRYYTEEEVTKKLASKSDTTHKHDDAYDAKGAAEAVQKNLDAVSDEFDEHVNNSNIHVTAANKTNWSSAYTHSQSAHARVDATKVADSTTNGNILINDVETNVYSHPNSGVTAGTYKSVTVNAQGHVTAGSNPTTLAGYGITDAPTKTEAQGYATAVKNELLNGAGAAYDTLKELGALIDDNTSAIDALEKVASGKADKEHGTHVTYSTTVPVMDGTASVGSASTVARSDHKHPTDTSRAAKADLDTHTNNTTVHITSTERTNWNAAQEKANEAYNLADLAANVVYVGPTAPTDPNVKVWINTSEEGTGVIPVLPRVATVTLAANKWSGSAEPYSQQITVATATTASKVDLQPTAQQIVSLQNAEISLMIENNGGVFTCYALGNKPTIDYTMQVLIQEVAYV
jgi:phage-related tail fiber protein